MPEPPDPRTIGRGVRVVRVIIGIGEDSAVIPHDLGRNVFVDITTAEGAMPMWETTTGLGIGAVVLCHADRVEVALPAAASHEVTVKVIGGIIPIDQGETHDG